MDDITEPRRHFPGRTPPPLPARYDRDLYSWAVEQAAWLRAGRIIEADAGNIAEELDDVGSEQYRQTCSSALRIILRHLLKWDHQPARRSRSWWASITLGRNQVRRVLRQAPGVEATARGSDNRSLRGRPRSSCGTDTSWPTSFRRAMPVFQAAADGAGDSLACGRVTNAEPDILFERRGVAGHVILNRPHALNAVSHDMVCTLAQKLDEWETDPAITRIVVSAKGGRAFSAGGDLRALYDLGRAGRYEDALAFFRAEYALNARIKHYRKPYVALIDGIVMGGGVGISVHGSHRVAGDKIHVRDARGGNWLFSRYWSDMVLAAAAGRARHLLRAHRRAPRCSRRSICKDRDSSSCLKPLSRAHRGFVQCGACRCAARRIRRAGRHGARHGSSSGNRSLVWEAGRLKIFSSRLDEEAAAGRPHAAFALATAAAIRTKSPTSLKIALAQMQRGASLDFAECMRTEFRIVSRVMRGHDFYEGVRAVIIDKDQTPRWEPATLEAVTAAEVEHYFAPLVSELELP